MIETKLYPHIVGVRGNDGERPGAIAVSACMDQSPHWPEQCRIIIGSPRQSPSLPGPLPDLGGWNMGVETAERLIATLQAAVRDVRTATGRATGHQRIVDYANASLVDDASWPQPPWLPDLKDAGTPAEEFTGQWTTQNGVVDAGSMVELSRYIADMRQREPVLARAVLMLRDGIGMGIEVATFETDAEDIPADKQHPVTIILGAIQRESDVLTCRIVSRMNYAFSVQYKRDDHWEPLTFLATGITPDAVITRLLHHVGSRAMDDSYNYWSTASRGDGGVTVILEHDLAEPRSAVSPRRVAEELQ